MYTHVRFPRTLPPEILDRYLARGWYRLGEEAMFTCRFLMADDELYSTIWIRLRLAGHRYSRRQRKRMQRLGRRFRIVAGAPTLDDARVALYDRYRGRLHDTLPATLEIGPVAGRRLFDTREIAVYEGSRLVAFSLFDCGRDSLQSVIGVFDPDEARHSLGFYTMLLEIEYGLASGMRYYYPGYVAPGYPRLDYKLRIGDVERYDPARRVWRPYGRLAPRDLPAEEIRERLAVMSACLERFAVPHTQEVYALYDLPDEMSAESGGLLHHPLYIDCGPRDGASGRLLVAYDLASARYELLRCVRDAHLETALVEEMPGVKVLRVAHRLAWSASPEPIGRMFARPDEPARPGRAARE